MHGAQAHHTVDGAADRPRKHAPGSTETDTTHSKGDKQLTFYGTPKGCYRPPEVRSYLQMDGGPAFRTRIAGARASRSTAIATLLARGLLAH